MISLEPGGTNFQVTRDKIEKVGYWLDLVKEILRSIPYSRFYFFFLTSPFYNNYPKRSLQVYSCYYVKVIVRRQSYCEVLSFHVCLSPSSLIKIFLDWAHGSLLGLLKSKVSLDIVLSVTMRMLKPRFVM